MTWKDLKIFTLQKIFMIPGDEIVEDDKTLPYLKSMPAVANEALQLLSTSGRYIKKKITIEQLAEGADPDESDADVKVTAQNGTYRYDLSELTDDFYSFIDSQIYLENGERYGRTSEFVIEGESTIALNASTVGKWTIYYNAYPQQITKDTPDNTVLSLHPEVAALMPLYMASQLYKDDDIGQAVQYRNEFEVAREELKINAARENRSADHFEDTSGWI